MEEDSAEYRTVIRHTSALRLAVKSDIIPLSGDLLSSGLISPGNEAELRNIFRSEEERAAMLVQLIQNKILQNRQHYCIFVGILRGRPENYEDTLCAIEQTFSAYQQIKETTDAVNRQTQAMDAMFGKLKEDDRSWKQNEDKFRALTREYETKKAEWVQFQKKRKEIAQGYENIVQDQVKRLRSYLLFFQNLSHEMDEFSVKTATDLSVGAEIDLRFGQGCSEYLIGVEKHLRELENRKVYIQSYRKELARTKEDLKKSLKKLNDLKSATDGCLNDIQECGEALEKCDKGLTDCRSRIDQIKKQIEEVNRQREIILQEVSDCEAKLTSHTKELEQCQSRLHQCIGKLENTSKELDSSIITASTTHGAVVGGVLGSIAVAAGAGLFIAATAPVSIPTLAVASSVAAGGAGSAVAGGIFGRREGITIQEDNERRRSALKHCQEDLEKCDHIIEYLGDIVKECRQEIKKMKEIIAKNRQS